MILTINGKDYNCEAYHKFGARLWYYTRESVAKALREAKKNGMTNKQLQDWFIVNLWVYSGVVEKNHI
jgi:hypothetical protein